MFSDTVIYLALVVCDDPKEKHTECEYGDGDPPAYGNEQDDTDCQTTKEDQDTDP